MSSQAGRAIDPPEATLAVRVAIASLGALAAISLLGALHILDLVSVPHPAWLGSGAIVCAIAGYLFWIYRRHDSRPWIDAVPDEGAGRVVLWHFVPVANIVRPYRALCEIWDATAPEDETSVPFHAPVSMFWAAVLGAGALITLQVFTGRSMSHATFITVEAFVRLLLAAIGATGVVMILQIERRWRRRYALLSARYAAPADPPRDVMTAAGPADSSDAWIDAGVPVPANAAAAADANAASSYGPATAIAEPGVSVAAERPHPSTSQRPAPLSPAAMTALADLRSAGKVASILALLMGGYILLMFAGGLSQAALATGGAGSSIVFVYVVIALLYAIPTIHLWSFSRAATQFAASPTEGNLRNALRFLGRFWAFIGGAVALFLILMVVLMGLGIFISLIAAAAKS
ncbi:MAG: DUF4328 domain-containing protein [Thermoanaerobaculia bacterium]